MSKQKNITIFDCLKKQVTSNFAATKAPKKIMCLFLIIRDYSQFSQTCSRYALLLKMIPRYRKQDLFDKHMGTIFG